MRWPRALLDTRGMRNHSHPGIRDASVCRSRSASSTGSSPRTGRCPLRRATGRAPGLISAPITYDRGTSRHERTSAMLPASIVDAQRARPAVERSAICGCHPTLTPPDGYRGMRARTHRPTMESDRVISIRSSQCRPRELDHAATRLHPPQVRNPSSSILPGIASPCTMLSADSWHGHDLVFQVDPDLTAW